jgi:hypothetical protein
MTTNHEMMVSIQRKYKKMELKKGRRRNKYRMRVII